MSEKKAPLQAHIMMDGRYIQDKMSGIGRYTQHIIEEMLALDSSLHFTLLTHPTRPRPIEHERVVCQTVGAPANSLRTRYTLVNQVDFDGVDLFHSPFNILPGKLPVPSVFTLHDIMWLLDISYCTTSLWRRLITGTFYRNFIPASVEQADRIMTVSNHSREEIERYFPEMQGRVHVTYNGLDSFFERRPSAESQALIRKYVPAGKKFVLVVGQGSPYKNHVGALAGYFKAFKDDPDVYFVLIRRFSRGGQQELQRLLHEPAIRDRIIHLEYVTGEELRAFYNAASVFAFPSLYEGFGLPVLEAMACATPVVTSNRGATKEIAGDAAFLIDPEDHDQIADALRAAIYDEDRRQSMIERGLARSQTFTWKASGGQVLDVYRRVLLERRH